MFTKEDEKKNCLASYNFFTVAVTTVALELHQNKRLACCMEANREYAHEIFECERLHIWLFLWSNVDIRLHFLAFVFRLQYYELMHTKFPIAIHKMSQKFSWIGCRIFIRLIYSYLCKWLTSVKQFSHLPIWAYGYFDNKKKLKRVQHRQDRN